MKYPCRSLVLQAHDTVLVVTSTSLGDEDAIVPPDQSERIFEAVRKQGLPCALIMFEGEQHARIT